MKKNKFRIIYGPVLFCLTGSCAFSQQNPVAAGSSITGGGGSASYSIGQINYVTASGTAGTVTQGIQQPYEISVISSLKESYVTTELSIYPNPTADRLSLQTSAGNDLVLYYKLISPEGKILKEEKIISDVMPINMDALANGIYYLEVLSITSQSEIKTFKIIKTK